MFEAQRVPRRPGEMVLNNVAYEVVKDTQGNYVWHEDPIPKESPYQDDFVADA